jgi:hypothetical protein
MYIRKKYWWVLLVPTIVSAKEHGLYYGAKATWPQIASLSFTYISLDEKKIEFKPFVQIEPGILGNKTSVGLGNVAGSQGATSFRLKATYLNMWGISSGNWNSKYGYLGPEFEAMVLFPSFHIGIYHPLDQEFHASSIKASFGIGILL